MEGAGWGMADHPAGKWIAPEDVPDPVALRGVMIRRERPVPMAPAPDTASALPVMLEPGTLDPLDPLDPPSLEAVHAPRVEPVPAGDFTLEPTPTPIADLDQVEDFTGPPGRRLPAAVWVGGTLLVVALLSMGVRLLATGAEAVTESPAPPIPATRPPVQGRATEPVPVDAAATQAEKPVAPARAPERKKVPPQASLRPTGESAPPEAVVRPITPPAAASLEQDAVAPRNPWSEVEP